MIGARVELNNAEQRLARFMARSRMENAIKRGITNAQVGSQDRLDIDLEGYGAELAFCKLFNVIQICLSLLIHQQIEQGMLSGWAKQWM